MGTITLGMDHPVITFVEKLYKFMDGHMKHLFRDESPTIFFKNHALIKRFLSAAKNLSNSAIEYRTHLIVERTKELIQELESELLKEESTRTHYNIEWPLSQIIYFNGKIETVLKNVSENKNLLNLAHFIKSNANRFNPIFGVIYKQMRAYYSHPSDVNFNAVKKKYVAIAKINSTNKADQKREIQKIKDDLLGLEVENML